MKLYLALGALALIFAIGLLFVLAVFLLAAQTRSACRKLAQTVTGEGQGAAAELLGLPVVAKDARMSEGWSDYLRALRWGHSPSAVDIGQYVSFEALTEGRAAFALAGFAPALLPAAGAAAAVLLLIFDRPAGEGALALSSLYPAALGVCLGLVLLLLFKLAAGAVQSAVGAFVKTIRRCTGGGPGGALLFSEVALALREQNALQAGFYEGMTRQTSQRFADSVIPVLEQIEEKINLFISAASERQAESMANLADAFVASVNASYAAQSERLGAIAGEMADIQERSTASFEKMRDITAVSAESLARLHESVGTVFSRFEGYLERLGAMSDALSGNLASLTQMTDYIRDNAQAQSGTIQTLTEYQKELTAVSGLYTSAMEQVVADMRDQHASTMTALRAASADMLKSGDHLRGAYGEFTASVTADIETVFRQFDENLTAISAHLSKSIGDLQEAVDELPCILRSIRLNPGEVL